MQFKFTSQDVIFSLFLSCKNMGILKVVVTSVGSGWCACHWTQGSRVQNPAEATDFKCDKNPQHTFLRMGSKAGDPMS
jgi:hypothetical protein